MMCDVERIAREPTAGPRLPAEIAGCGEDALGALKGCQDARDDSLSPST